MGVAPIYEITTPWGEEELADIGYDQVHDVMILTHLKHPPQRLIRQAHNYWLLDEMPRRSSVPQVGALSVTANKPVTTDAYDRNYLYAVTCVNEETGEESLPSDSEGAVNDLTLNGNNNVVTWSPVSGIARYNIYRGENDILGFVGSTGGTAEFIDRNIAPDFSVSYPLGRDPFPGEGDYPAVVTFYDQRMVLGRTLNRPSAVYASQSANLFNFNASRPAQDSDAVTFALSARRVNAILHMVPLKDLIVFTTDAVWAVRGSRGYLSPNDIELTPQGYRGASKMRPVTIDEVIFFATSLGNQFRTLNYEFEAEGYRGNDLSVFVKHFFDGHTLVDAAWAEEPLQTIFLVRSDGKLLTLAWQREQEVWGWTLCSTVGWFESVCVIPENGEHVPYFVVRRNAGGPTQRRVERLATSRWTDIESACYLDSALTYDGEPISLLRGLDHLNGVGVHVVADGALVKRFHTVEDGEVQLPRPASKVVVGIPYEAWVRTLPAVALGATGPLKGYATGIADLKITMRRSRAFDVGLGREGVPGVDPASSAEELAGEAFPIKARTDEAPGELPRLISGTVEVDLPAGDWTPDASIIMRQVDPFPMEVTGITMDVEFNDG